MCTCAALRVDVHGRDNFTNFGLHRLTFKAIMISSHLTKGIAEALLAIVTSALVSRRDRTDRTCTIGAAGHCPKADKNQKPLFAVRVQHVAQIQMVRTRGVQVCRRAIYLKIWQLAVRTITGSGVQHYLLSPAAAIAEKN